MTPALLRTFANARDGLEATVYATGPTFRVVFRDVDAGETIATINGIPTAAAAEARARKLTGQDRAPARDGFDHDYISHEDRAALDAGVQS
jgi:hypothetical protein